MPRSKFILLTVLAFLGTNSAAAGETAWYFSAEEINTAYRYQEQFGSRLRNPLKPTACFLGQSEFAASFQGKEFVAPCRFIIETTHHLKLLLEQGAAKYLFPLDADHAHLAVPIELWERKYRHMPSTEILPQLLRESRLVALYHTAEHLVITDPKTGRDNGAAKQWRVKRNVLGFFDGNPLKILPPLPDGLAQNTPDQYKELGMIYFLAHRLGEMVFSTNGKAVPFDLSFDEDFAAVAP